MPGTGWPEPGGFLPREALALVGKVAAEGICGLEVVEVSPPYDTSDITALLATRVIVDVLGSIQHPREDFLVHAQNSAGALREGRLAVANARADAAPATTHTTGAATRSPSSGCRAR